MSVQLNANNAWALKSFDRIAAATHHGEHVVICGNVIIEYCTSRRQAVCHAQEWLDARSVITHMTARESVTHIALCQASTAG